MLMRALPETLEHTGSYYAATLGAHETWPALHGAVEADVCVVGGGFSGVSAALHLAERGFKVVLLEARRIGWGATGRNGGQLIGGFSMDPDDHLGALGAGGARQLWEMGTEAVEIVKQRVEQHAIECDLRFGYCDVALKPRHLKQFEQTRQRQLEVGYPCPLQIVGRDELRSLIRSDLYLGGMINEGYGHLHPLKLCVGEARAAAALGASIHEQTAALRVEHGERPVVHTALGQVRARFVALCCDAYLGTLEPRLASRNLPAASFIIATEPLGARRQDVMTRNLAVCDQRWALDYFRFSADGRMLFGGATNYTGLAPRDVTATIRRKMVRVFPQLTDARIDYTWGGLLGISLSRVPQLGRLSDTVYYAQGYSGHGVAPTHLAGRLLAEVMAGHAERFDLFARFRHLPFPGGARLRRPLYALGMMYYRLRDWL